MTAFAVNDLVVKVGGAYEFPGTVVAVFSTLAGAVRVVVESSLIPGCLMIYSPGQLRRREP